MLFSQFFVWTSLKNQYIKKSVQNSEQSAKLNSHSREYQIQVYSMWANP